MEKKAIAFIVACKKYFGFSPGQTLNEFKEEVSKLTPADRKEMAEGLSKEFGEEVAA